MDLYVSLEQLPAYAESTARTLPVTGLCSPRRAALDAIWPSSGASGGKRPSRARNLVCPTARTGSRSCPRRRSRRAGGSENGKIHDLSMHGEKNMIYYL